MSAFPADFSVRGVLLRQVAAQTELEDNFQNYGRGVETQTASIQKA
jgi:hypothetical protein